MLKLETARRDGTTHMVMSSLEVMHLPIEWPLCGGHIHYFRVSIGSIRIPDSSAWNTRLMDSSGTHSVTGH